MNTISKELKDLDFVLQKHKFRIDSSTDIHFGLITDAGSGIMFTKNGASLFTTDLTSTEVVGLNVEPGQKIPAKIIRAMNGDIVLDAEDGNIILRGNNVQIHAVDALGGQIIIDSSKIIQMNSPIANYQGDKFNVAATNSIDLGGGSAAVHGEYSQENTTGTDEIKASFFGKILSAIKKFKNFFNSICGV